MKKQKLVRNLSMAALLAGAILVTGGTGVQAQTDTGTVGSGCCSKSGYLGSGNRDGGGGTIGSGTRSEDGGTIGSGVGFSQDSGGALGSGGGRSAVTASSGDEAETFFGSIWRFFF